MRTRRWGRGSLPCRRWVFAMLVLFAVSSRAQEGTDTAEQAEEKGTNDERLTNRRGKFPQNFVKLSDMGDDLVITEHGDVVVPSEGFSDAFVTSLSIILVSEMGDETFIIAALMAMRHPRSIVLSGALSALVFMTVLSTGLGRIVPNLISRKHTNAAATVLYTFFGARLLYIAWRADPNNSAQKEFEEVEEKLEAGAQRKSSVRKFFSRLLTPVFLEAFLLTFLAEWGDRSQIATIALASHKNAVGVAIGSMLGHSICTSLAVVGGRLLALRISQRTVATIGGLLFICFAISSYVYPPM